MSRRRKKHEVADPNAPELIRSDKRRGIVHGIVVGEALGRAVDGLERDTILRTHGRVVRPMGKADRPLADVAEQLARALDQKPSQSPVTIDVAAPNWPPGALEWLVAAPLTVRSLADVGPTEAAASVREGLAPHDDDGAIGSAGAVLAAMTRLALDHPPYDTLAAASVVAVLRSVAGDGLSAELTTVAQFARSPPAPSDCLPPFAHLPAALATSLVVVLALLVRPRALRDAVIFAVNLGGASAVRGALTCAIAGAHRGAACIPARWSERVAAYESATAAAATRALS